MAKENLNESQNVILTEDPKAIKNLLQSYQKSEGKKTLLNEGRNLVLKQVQDIANKINQNFEQDNISKALVLVKDLYQYKYELNTIEVNIKNAYTIVRRQMDNKFQVAYNDFMNQFLQRRRWIGKDEHYIS
ncbi:unnamed protein product [Rotaria sp. Silwood2]|nr:unnamed protein product [Rotaria sp. Silwood2]